MQRGMVQTVAPTATGKRNYFATNQSAEHANCARDPQARSKAGNGSFFGVLMTNDAGYFTLKKQLAGKMSPVCGPNHLPPATPNSTPTFVRHPLEFLLEEVF